MNAEALLRKTVHPPCTEEVTVVVPTDRRELSIGDRISLRIGLWLLLRAARADERTGDLTREQVALQLARERAASAASRHLLTYGPAAAAALIGDTMTIHLTPSAVLRPLELPARADAGPTPLLRAYAEVRNRTIIETSGREDDTLSPEELLPVLHDSIASKKRQWCIEENGETIGCVATAMLQDGDADTALGVISILKARTDRGIGTAALAALEDALRVEGIRQLMGWVEHHGEGSDMLHSPTGFGAVPRDGAARFLDRRGFRLEQVVRTSAWAPDAASLAHLRRARETAQAHAADYRVVQWMLPTPDEFVDGYAWMKSRMSTDVPDAELGTPEEVWDSARVRELEEHHAAKGFAVQVTAAQHVATGELCAFNELAIRASDPADTSHQHDTLVLAGHRGHRLGMLVKAAGLLAWHARYPDSPKVITYNAEENRRMLDINETLGFAPIAYEGAWKKELK